MTPADDNSERTSFACRGSSYGSAAASLWVHRRGLYDHGHHQEHSVYTRPTTTSRFTCSICRDSASWQAAVLFYEYFHGDQRGRPGAPSRAFGVVAPNYNRRVHLLHPPGSRQLEQVNLEVVVGRVYTECS